MSTATVTAQFSVTCSDQAGCDSYLAALQAAQQDAPTRIQNISVNSLTITFTLSVQDQPI